MEIIELLQLPKIGAKNAILLHQNEDQLNDFQFTSSEIKHAKEKSEKIKEKCVNNAIQIIDYFHSDYPSHLKNIPSPPAILYVQGNIDLLKNEGIACVGTRHPSSFGKEATQVIAGQLSSQKTIVSGLALGIDAIAHQATLKEKKETIAILGSGLLQITPKQNHSLAEEIKESGLLLSEYEPDTEVRSYQLVARNRLQSGLSSDVIAVESKKDGGTMHTTLFALKQNKKLWIPVNQKNKNPSDLQYLLEKKKAEWPNIFPAYKKETNFLSKMSNIKVHPLSKKDISALI